MKTLQHIRHLAVRPRGSWPTASLWGMLLALVGLMSSCEFRQVYPEDYFNDEQDPRIWYDVDVDWSELDEEPAGMSLYFYPSDGSMPYVRLTNDVHHYECLLPEDDYSLLVFNRSADEFADLGFLNLNVFNLAEVYAVLVNDPDKSRIDRLFDLPPAASPSHKNNTRAKVTTTSLKPRSFASSAIQSTQAVFQQGGQMTRPLTRAKVTTTSIKPRTGISTMTVSVRVRGLDITATGEQKNFVVAVNGAMTGLAPGLMLNSGAPSLSSSLTQELDDWTITPASGSSDGVGTVTCVFGVFGTSPIVTSGVPAMGMSRILQMTGIDEYRESSDEDDINNYLYLNFRLSDDTYIPYRFEVTDRIVEHHEGGEEGDDDEEEVTLTIDVGVSVDGVDDDLNDPIILPETGIPYGGFQPSVTGWGDSVTVITPTITPVN